MLRNVSGNLQDVLHAIISAWRFATNLGILAQPIPRVAMTCAPRLNAENGKRLLAVALVCCGFAGHTTAARAQQERWPGAAVQSAKPAPQNEERWPSDTDPRIPSIWFPQTADDPDQKHHFESYGGADIGRNYWLIYSGITVAPFSDMHENGLRLRASGGYGGYSYTAAFSRDRSLQISYEAATNHIEALFGYQYKLGDITAKAFVGAAEITHAISPSDPNNPVNGKDFGFKGVLEFWWDIAPLWYGSLDLSYAEAHRTRSARLRVARRFSDHLSIGFEGRLNQDNSADAAATADGQSRFAEEPLDYAWLGLFGRYEWKRGEVSLSGGVNAKEVERVADGASDDLSFYATANFAIRF
ncbi:MAG: cellulose biosynthesis protein BcsS [Pseudomonadota bacterium]